MTRFASLLVARWGVRPVLNFYLTLFTLLFLAACSSDPQPASIAGTLIFPGDTGNIVLGDETEASQFATSAFVPGEVIVKFTSNVQMQSLSVLSVQNITVQRVGATGVPRAALYRAEGLNEAETLALIDELSARPDVAYAEPNTIKTIAKTPNDPFYAYQWHYEAMNLPAAWDIEDGAAGGVTVAVIDTGSVPHPDLQGVWAGGYDFVSNPAYSADGDGYDADPTDLGGESFYHGTHVAGTVAASTDNGSGVAGVSWGAKLLSVRVLGATGIGTLSDTVNGALWAAGEPVEGVPINPNPAQVINLSLGGEAPCSMFEQSAIDTVRAKGVTVVVAAGNSDIDVAEFSPANCDGVIAVGATGPRGRRAPYSNYGGEIDVMAPGGDRGQSVNVNGDRAPAGVLSTVKNEQTSRFDYAFYTGTSMAAPHVSGLVALMLAQEPGLSPDAIEAKLKGSATPLSARACGRADREDCGAGLVDASAALGGSARSPLPLVSSPVRTYVQASLCTTTCERFDESRSRRQSFVIDTPQQPFLIDDLVSGTYVLEAWQDLDDDGKRDEGEPSGRYEDPITVGSGDALTGRDIYLSEPFNTNSD